MPGCETCERRPVPYFAALRYVRLAKGFSWRGRAGQTVVGMESLFVGGGLPLLGGEVVSRKGDGIFDG